jgi:hypothetical protein
MDIITDLLKTTLSGAVDKFSHSYTTLCQTLSLEIQEEVDCTTDIDALDLEIKNLQLQRRKKDKKRKEY